MIWLPWEHHCYLLFSPEKTHCTVDLSTEITMYKAGVSLGAVAFLAMMVLLLCRYKGTLAASSTLLLFVLFFQLSKFTCNALILHSLPFSYSFNSSMFLMLLLLVSSTSNSCFAPFFTRNHHEDPMAATLKAKTVTLEPHTE